MGWLNRQKIEFVIFDWDGTLIDSIPKIMGILERCYQDFGLQMPEVGEIRRAIGLPLFEACQIFLPGAPEEQVKAFEEAYVGHWRSDVLPLSPLIEGAREALERLNAAGLKMAVATGKKRNGFEREARQLGVFEYFQDARCAGEAENKPHPEMLNQLMLACGYRAEQSLMVGDTGLDLTMANRAGIAGIGVATGQHSQDELRVYDPAASLLSVVELPGLLGL